MRCVGGWVGCGGRGEGGGTQTQRWRGAGPKKKERTRRSSRAKIRNAVAEQSAPTYKDTQTRTDKQDAFTQTRNHTRTHTQRPIRAWGKGKEQQGFWLSRWVCERTRDEHASRDQRAQSWVNAKHTRGRCGKEEETRSRSLKKGGGRHSARAASNAARYRRENNRESESAKTSID